MAEIWAELCHPVLTGKALRVISFGGKRSLKKELGKNKTSELFFICLEITF